MQSVTIVIPNFNGAQLLKKNLPSVCEYAEKSGMVKEIIVVDDGSNDDSLGVLERDFSQLRSIVHKVNQGFSEAVYSGVKAANTELVLLLNSDIQLVEDIIRPLADYFSEPDTFAVSPLFKDEKGHIDQHAWNLRRIRSGRIKRMSWNIDEALKKRAKGKLLTSFTSGGSMMVRRSMMMDLGGFHPIFKPFYGEDFDLGLRAWSRGWASYFEPGVGVIHQEKGSISVTQKVKFVKTIQRRNRYLLEWIHLPCKQLIFSTLPASLFQLLGELISFRGANLKGFYLAVRKLGAVRNARVDIDKHRLLSLEQIIDRVSPKQG